MRPIPVLFHIGPLQVHTYGIGLAVTFLFGYWYFARRLRDHGYPDRWLGDAFLWIIGASLVGARVFHVAANWSFYSVHLGQIPLVWHGGLSSFGGLAFGIPMGLWQTRRRCPQLRLGVAADLLAPVMLAGWAVGRLLGPQLMIAGGGYRTNAWYGMYYAGQVGKRVPVPLLQAAECAVIFVVLLWVERRLARRGGRPIGLLTALAVTLWDASRISDEHFFLAQPGHTGSLAVQIGATALTLLGLIAMAVLWRRDRHRGPDVGELAPLGSGGSLSPTEPEGTAAPPPRGAPAVRAGP